MGKSSTKKQRKNGHSWRSKQQKQHSRRELTKVEKIVVNLVDNGRPDVASETYFGAYIRSKMPPLTPPPEDS